MLTPDHTTKLMQLHEWSSIIREAETERDKLIVELLSSGVSLRQIASHTNISHTTILRKYAR